MRAHATVGRTCVHVHGTDKRGRDKQRSCVCACAFVCVHVFARDMNLAIRALCVPECTAECKAELQGLQTAPMGLTPWLHAKPAIFSWGR